MNKEKDIVFFSAVDALPFRVLKEELVKKKINVSSIYFYLEEKVRSKISKGPLSRLGVRIAVFFIYPFKAFQKALFLSVNTIIVTTNPFFLPYLMVLTKGLHKKKVVTLIYDLYPDVLEANGTIKHNSILSRILAYVTHAALQRSSKVVFISDFMAQHTLKRYGPVKNWSIIPTGAKISSRVKENGSHLDASLGEWCKQKILVSYVGNMGHMHDWETISKVIKQLSLKNKNSHFLKFFFAGFGSGMEALKNDLKDVPEDWVKFYPPLNDQDWKWVMSKTALALVTMKTGAGNTCFPSKAMSAMAENCSILAIAPKASSLVEMVEQHQCGWCAEPGDWEAVQRFLMEEAFEPELLNSRRKNAEKAIRCYYDISVVANQWLALRDNI